MNRIVKFLILGALVASFLWQIYLGLCPVP